MRQNYPEQEFSEEFEVKERTYHRLLQLYYNMNFTYYANTLKKCIPDIDTTAQNRMIRKNDKIWVEANMSKIYQKASEKLQKMLMSKNMSIKNTHQCYRNQFQALSPQKVKEIMVSQSNPRTKTSQQSKFMRKMLIKPVRNKSFTIQSMNSQPSATQVLPRNTLSSKRVFRVRQHKQNFYQAINNTRYIEKLQRVKLQSSFAQFFFDKQQNPQQLKPRQSQKSYLDKLKTMTNIRWNFSLREKSEHLPKHTLLRQNNNILGFQLKKDTYYKPKSKCQSRNTKIFLNF